VVVLLLAQLSRMGVEDPPPGDRHHWQWSQAEEGGCCYCYY
jgi:hypothetical protein